MNKQKKISRIANSIIILLSIHLIYIWMSGIGWGLDYQYGCGNEFSIIFRHHYAMPYLYQIFDTIFNNIGMHTGFVLGAILLMMWLKYLFYQKWMSARKVFNILTIGIIILLFANTAYIWLSYFGWGPMQANNVTALKCAALGHLHAKIHLNHLFDSIFTECFTQTGFAVIGILLTAWLRHAYFKMTRDISSN